MNLFYVSLILYTIKIQILSQSSNLVICIYQKNPESILQTICLLVMTVYSHLPDCLECYSWGEAIRFECPQVFQIIIILWHCECFSTFFISVNTKRSMKSNLTCKNIKLWKTTRESFLEEKILQTGSLQEWAKSKK